MGQRNRRSGFGSVVRVAHLLQVLRFPRQCDRFFSEKRQKSVDVGVERAHNWAFLPHAGFLETEVSFFFFFGVTTRFLGNYSLNYSYFPLRCALDILPFTEPNLVPKSNVCL